MSSAAANVIHKRKEPIDICRLPLEILSHILRQATLLAGLLDPPEPLELQHRKSIDKELFREHRISLVTKRYLVRVCRDWHVLATPFLYEAVLMGKVKSLHGLCEGLNRRLGSSDDGVRTGIFVKRIDYRRTRPRIPDPTVTGDPRLLPTIFSRTPNLQILDLFMYDGSIHHIVNPADTPAILNAIPNSLKAFCYSYSTYSIGPPWAHFFSTHTQLQTCAAELIVGISPSDPQSTLAGVQTLLVHCGLPLTHVFAKVDFPNVRRLVWYSHRARLPDPLRGDFLSSDLSALVPLFKTLGEQLTVVEVHTEVLRDDEGSHWQSMCSTIQKYCPPGRLERIDLVWNEAVVGHSYSSPFPTQTTFPFPSSVTTLGVRKQAGRMSLADVRYLCDRVPRWAQNGGSLKRVQFTEKADVDGIKSLKKLNVGKRVRELAQLGVEIVDDQGQPLNLPDVGVLPQTYTA